MDKDTIPIAPDYAEVAKHTQKAGRAARPRTKEEELDELKRAGKARDPDWRPWNDAAYSERLFREQREADMAEADFPDEQQATIDALVAALQNMVDADELTKDDYDQAKSRPCAGAGRRVMEDEDEHARIVHQLRSDGWERWDAIEEADRLMSERITRREDHLRPPIAQPSGAQ